MLRFECGQLSRIKSASNAARTRSARAHRSPSKKSLQRLDAPGIVGNELGHLKLARFSLDHGANGPGNGFRNLLQRLLLVAAGNRAIGTRADQQESDRLFVIGAGHQRDAYRESAIGWLAHVALVILSEFGGPPCLDLVDRGPPRSKHAAVDDQCAPDRP